MKQSFSFINLGLPSGTRWADRNILANKPCDCGAFLSYRALINPEVAGGGHFLVLGPRIPGGCHPEMKLIPLAELFGLIGSLALCIPTEEQMNELVSGCIWKRRYTAMGWGFEVASRYNGNSIFLPTCGWYSNEAMQQFSRIQRSYEVELLTEGKWFNHLIDQEAVMHEGDSSCCQYLTRSTDTRFAPLGWSGGARVLKVIGNPLATATIATLSRDLWMPIRPAICL